MTSPYKIVFLIILIFSASGVVFATSAPEWFLGFIEYVPAKVLAYFLLLLNSALLAFVILWYFHEPKPTRIIAGLCRLLTASFVMSLANILSVIPSINNISLRERVFTISFGEPTKDIIILCISILGALVFSCVAYAFVYVYNDNRLSSRANFS